MKTFLSSFVVSTVHSTECSSIKDSFSRLPPEIDNGNIKIYRKYLSQKKVSNAEYATYIE